MMETLFQDVKFGLRMLRKNLGFTLVAVLTLALGIGANTAIFSVTDAMLLRELPVAEPQQLVAVHTRTDKGELKEDFSYPLYRALREHESGLSGILATADRSFGIATASSTERVQGAVVSANYFSVLGVRLTLGAGFGPDDERPGGPPLAVISHSLWQQHFGADPQVINKTFTLNGRPFTVLGVTEPGFRGIVRGLDTQVWVPLPWYGALRGNSELLNTRETSWLSLFGRLKPETTPQQAAARMTAFRPAGFEAWLGKEMVLTPAAGGDDSMVAEFRQPLRVLLVAVGLILLIACANVANLLLARGEARQKEIGIRVAVGASRARVVRQLLTEAALLSLAGGAAGLLVAIWVTDSASALQGSFGTVRLPMALDVRVLGFAFALSLATALLFGAIPALRSSRTELVPVLKETQAGSGSGRVVSLRNGLVMVQVSLSLVLLIGAGLFLRSLANLRAIDTGFSADRVLAMRVDLRLLGYSEEKGRAFYDQALQRLASIPGVTSATSALVLPATAGGVRLDLNPGSTDPPLGEVFTADIVPVGPRFFETLGLPLLRGREFRPQDTQTSQRVIIVNEYMARRMWGDQDPVGRRFFDSMTAYEVVGVAQNTKYRNLRETPRMTMYKPAAQDYSPGMALLVGSSGNPYDVLPAVRRELQSIDSALPIFGIRTVPEHVNNSLYLDRMRALLLSLFGALALALAGIGVYGVMSYSVAQRTRELGIRIALGARRANVIALVLRTAMLVAGCGVVLGLVASFWLSRLVASQLYLVKPLDATTLLTASAVLLVAALFAVYLPARRAAKVDPMVALRYE